MPNKPRLPEGSSSNLFRAAVLWALAPACSMTPAPRIATQGSGDIKGTVNYGFANMTKDRKVIEDRTYESASIPDEVSDQPLEIAGVHISALIAERDNDKARSLSRYSEQMIIDPSARGENCHVKPITITKQMYDNSDNAEAANVDIVLSNADILSHMMTEVGVIDIGTVTKSATESLKNGGGEHNSTDLRDFTEITYRHIINGYSIKRGIGGRQDTVEFTVQMLECENQRRGEATNIAAEVRGKLARGSKAGNRR